MKEQKNKIKKTFSILVIIAIIMIGSGISYALLEVVLFGNSITTLTAGNLSLKLNESQSLSIANAIPVSDEEGKTTTPFTFSVENTGSYEVNYEIILDGERVFDPYVTPDFSTIRYQLVVDGVEYIIKNYSSIKDIIYTASIGPNETVNFELRNWVDYNVTSIEPNSIFKASININAVQKLKPETADEDCFEAISGVIYDYSNYCPKNVIIPAKIDNVTVTTIADNAFSNKGLTGVHLPNTVTKIESNAFSKNQLTEVTISTTLVTIEQYAFFNNKIRSIEIPETVKTIGDSAFRLNQINELILPDVQMDIHGKAFVTNYLPHDTATIYARNADGTIDNSTILSYGGYEQKVVIPNTVTTINSHAFYGNAISFVYIPPTVTSVGEGAFNDNHLLGEDAYFYKRNSDGSIDNSVLISYGGSETSIILPTNITTIGKSAFQETKVDTVTLPNNLISIEEYAFRSTLLNTITIPSTVTTLGSRLFHDTTTLTEIIIQGKSNITEFTSIDEEWNNENTPVTFNP